MGLFLWITDAATGQLRQRDFPYQALVISESAQVHSGPASAHYATDELKQNSVVDVYRHDPGGWCAIRPPVGSFSLVPESVVEKSAAGVGTMTQDGVQAWVGTRLGSVEQPMWQVKLKLGEQVVILDETSWPNPEGNATTWLQIAPPAGEFRWIRSSDIKLPKNLTDLPEVADTSVMTPTQLIESELPADEIGSRGESAQTGFQESDPMFDDGELKLDPPSEKDGTTNRGWKQATHPIRVADRRTDGGRIEPFKTPAVDIPSLDRNRLNSTPGSLPPRDTLAGNLPPANPSSASSSYDPVATIITPISGPVSARIRELESALTTQLLGPPAQWQLEPILRQATAVSSSTSDVQEQQHALRLVDKIRNCANIQSSFETAYNGAPPTTSTNAAPVGTGFDAGIDEQVQLGTTYDAFGWLNELVRDKGKMSPTYVLEDDQGKIIYHIAPAPGLNLNRYLNNKVGVIGRRGFHRTLNMNHVTAERIVVLDKLRR